MNTDIPKDFIQKENQISRNRICIRNLPISIIINICFYIDPESCISLSLTCKSIYTSIKNCSIIWRFYCYYSGFVQSYNRDQICIGESSIIEDKIIPSGYKYIEHLKYSLLPNISVDEYKWEFGDNTHSPIILEYNWWANLLGKKYKSKIQNYFNSNIHTKNYWINSHIDITLLTNIINWRIVYYVNVNNKFPQESFWLKMGAMDILIPIPVIKIQSINDLYTETTILSIVASIKFLSILHICRQFIKLSCPIRIRELHLGGRPGAIITSHPSSRGNYILELPYEVIWKSLNTGKSTSFINNQINLYKVPYSCLNECYEIFKESSHFHISFVSMMLHYILNYQKNLSTSNKSCLYEDQFYSLSINKELYQVDEIIKGSQMECRVDSDLLKYRVQCEQLSKKWENCKCNISFLKDNISEIQIEGFDEKLEVNNLVSDLLKDGTIFFKESILKLKEDCFCNFPDNLIGYKWLMQPKITKDAKRNSCYQKVYISNKSEGVIIYQSTLEITLEISYRIPQNSYSKFKVSTSNNRNICISISKDKSSLGDLLNKIGSTLKSILNEEVYMIILLQGIGWIGEINDGISDVQESLNNDLICNLIYQNIARLFNIPKISFSNHNQLYPFQYLLACDLSKHLAFVNSEKLNLIIEEIPLHYIQDDIKNHLQMIKENLLFVGWIPQINTNTLNHIILNAGYLPLDKHLLKKDQYSTDRLKFIGLRICRENHRFFCSHESNSCGKTLDYDYYLFSQTLNKALKFKTENSQINDQYPIINSTFSPIITNQKIKRDSNITIDPDKFVENSISSSIKPFKDEYKKQVQVATLYSTLEARQFEFHYTRPDWIIIGTADGQTKLIDRYRDLVVGQESASITPIIGLGWYHNHPEFLVSGSCIVGSISVIRINDNPLFINESESEHDDSILTSCSSRICHSTNSLCGASISRDLKYPLNSSSLPYTLKVQKECRPFQQLSSVSINSTDDFFLASGFGKSVACYDARTGEQTKLFQDIHMSHINTVRFSHYHPQVFSTASFDSTCKLWDMRQRIRGNRPVMRFDLQSMVVLTSFCPSDDSKLVISGVDSAIRQVDLRSYSNNNDVCKFDIPSLNSTQSFRRSTYNSSGEKIISANTEESILRIFDSNNGRSIQNVDMKEFRSPIKSEFSKVAQKYPEYDDRVTFNGFYGGSNSTDFSGGHLNNSNTFHLNRLASYSTAVSSNSSISNCTIGNFNSGNIFVQSVRGHPIFADVTGALLNTHKSTGISKLALLKI
ncbi:F-box domain-containing protein [Cryptosporidium andersoni]|uniref:F-box domain-containing protein n=1 Tax=Cryptosporidium andersoni TaxID=117008 RepID=A0A1J4MH02_9CRYT|nr:F-box domain-containing protein [Cryptosporidium andersoni]